MQPCDGTTDLISRKLDLYQTPAIKPTSDLVLRLVSWMPNVWLLCKVVTLWSADKLHQNSLHYNKTVCIIINSIKTVYILLLCSATAVVILFILPFKTLTNNKEKFCGDCIKSTHKHHHYKWNQPLKIYPISRLCYDGSDNICILNPSSYLFLHSQTPVFLFVRLHQLSPDL